MASAEEFAPTTSWGSYGQGKKDSQFNAPEGIAVDQQGNVYVADTNNDRIQKFSANGTFIGKLGRHGVQNGTFKNPEGIAVDQQGNVYVADTGNDRIQKFSANFSGNGTFLTKWGKHGVKPDSRFNAPEGIAVDQQGNVYVADTNNNRIQKFSTNGTFLGKFGTFGTNDGSFDAPEGIAVDQQGNVYVADTGNNRIQKFSKFSANFSTNGTFLGKFGSFGREDDQLKYPSAVVVDSQGNNIFIVDTSNNRVTAIRTLPERQVGTSAQSDDTIRIS
jgi:tripartite motif-containing protein 71